MSKTINGLPNAVVQHGLDKMRGAQMYGVDVQDLNREELLGLLGNAHASMENMQLTHMRERSLLRGNP